MNIANILELYDLHERREASYPLYRREETESVTRMISLNGGHNLISYSKLSDIDADGVIEGEFAYFKNPGCGFEWKLYSHDQPADLKERLAVHGFAIGEDEAIMALDLEKLPAELLAGSSRDIRRVSDEKIFADYAAVNARAWPDDEHDDAWMATMKATLRDDNERMSAYVAYVDGIPVCASRIDFPEHSPFASLWGGATLEPYRKRGIYTAILFVRAREAIARGYRFLTIDASPMSGPIAVRHGFQLLAISNPCDSPGDATYME
ncbi:MAG: hypothetical protein Q8O15_02800 [Rectinemataceae bacterium]|nr:hypothetical protein [Rectinemataceae bacterium]